MVSGHSQRRQGNTGSDGELKRRKKREEEGRGGEEEEEIMKVAEMLKIMDMVEMAAEAVLLLVWSALVEGVETIITDGVGMVAICTNRGRRRGGHGSEGNHGGSNNAGQSFDKENKFCICRRGLATCC